MSGYTRPTMVGEAHPGMEDYTGYSSTAPTWARLRPTRTATHTALAPVDVWSAKPSTHAGVNADRSSTAPLPRKVLKAKLPTAPPAPAPARASAPARSSTSRSTSSSEQWAAMTPPPRGLSAVLEMTEDDSADFDTSETASMSSELSTSTQATSVASDDTVTAKDGSKVGARNTVKVIHPAPIATTTARLKARPRAKPLPPSEPSTAALSKSPTTSRRTLHIQVTPSQELTTQQKKVEKDLRLKIEQLESETQSLRSEQNRLLEELDSASERLSVTGQEKKDVVKERNRERDTRQLLYSDLEDQRRLLEEFRNKAAEQKAAITGIENERDLLRSDLDEQRRILDEFRSNFGLQKGMLDEAEKERDELRESKAMFEEKATKLEKELAQALEDRKDHEGLLIAQIAALELTKDALDTRIDTRDKEIVELIVGRENSKKEAEEHEAQIKNLTEAKEAQLKTLTEEKETQVKAITEEKDAQIKALTEENEALTEAKKAADEEKEEAVTRVTELTDEKDKESQELQALLDTAKEEIEKLKTEVETLTSDKELLQKQLDDLEAEKTEHQATINTMTIDLGGAKDANITLASQKLDADTETGKVKEQLAAAQAEIAQLEEAKKTLESENEELKSRPAEVIKVELADDKPAEDAPSDDAAKELAAEAAKVAGLTAANEELQNKIGELEAEAEKATGLAEEKATLETKVAELEKQASEAPALAEQNKALSAQLADANARLGQIHAAYQAATAQVQDLMSQVALLRARQPSQSRSSSRKRKSTATDSKALVVVRNPSDRGSLQIMRKCDLRPTSPKRSSSSVTDSEN